MTAGIITLFMDFIEAGSITRTDKFISHLMTVQLLFQNFPGEMALEFQLECLRFYSQIFRSLKGAQDEARKMSAIFASLNAFLIRNGLDIFSHLADFHLSKTRP